MNESDILVTQAPEAWHPMEKSSTEACKWLPSLDPWGIQTNPQVPASRAAVLQLVLDQLP